MSLSRGQTVTVNPTPIGLRGSYPAANWVTKPTQVVLKEDAAYGTLDVIDVEQPGNPDDNLSIYGFNLDAKHAPEEQHEHEERWD